MILLHLREAYSLCPSPCRTLQIVCATFKSTMFIKINLYQNHMQQLQLFMSSIMFGLMKNQSKSQAYKAQC